MKQTVAALNLFVPSDLKASSPFLSSFVTGLVFSPLLNVFRMLQLGRIRGERYPALVRFFFTPAGARLYVHNTLLFAPGQGLGMMACFGSKDFLIPFLGGYNHRERIFRGLLFTVQTWQQWLDLLWLLLRRVWLS
jgi:hypothetical protein